MEVYHFLEKITVLELHKGIWKYFPGFLISESCKKVIFLSIHSGDSEMLVVLLIHVGLLGFFVTKN